MKPINLKALGRILLIAINLSLFTAIYSQGLEIFYDTSYPRQIGGSFPLGVRYTDHKGKMRMTRGFLGGKQLWVYYYINVMGGTFRNGMVHIVNSPETITDHKISVSAHLMKDLKIFKTIDIPLTYTGLTVADYTPYEELKYGQDGDVLNVYVSKYYDSVYNGELLKVKIYSKLKNNALVYYVHPTEGQIHIIANGGYGQNGCVGTGLGCAENGGDGGDGGTVYITIQETARDCVDKIKITNYGGYGGTGGIKDGVSGTNGRNGLNGPVPSIEFVNNILQ